MTLTTEQLRARAKFWREKAVEAKWESVSIAQDMLQNADAFDELAANREAQPVALDVIARFKEWNTGFPVEKFKADYVIGWVLANYYAPPAPAYPERLPCPVHLLPGLKFGKGVPTRSMLDALVRRAEYEAELEAMTPGQRAENDARLEKLKALIPQAAPAVPDAIPEVDRGEGGSDIDYMQPQEIYDMGKTDGWNDCRAAMLAAAPGGGNDHDTRR